MNLNELSKQIHAQNKVAGWWDNPDLCIYQTLQLISTEIAEATEGERKNLMDVHLPHRRMGEVALADALMRALDIGGRYGWQVDEKTRPVQEAVSGMSIAGKHLYLNACLIGLTHRVRLNDRHSRSLEDPEKAIIYHYSRLVKSIVEVAGSREYDIYSALLEKLEYNKTRVDHSKEMRAKPNGKKF